MKFKSFRNSKKETKGEDVEVDESLGAVEEGDEQPEDAPRERKMPSKETAAAPPEQAKPQTTAATDAAPETIVHYKFGIADRLNRAVEGHPYDSSLAKRSPDLVPLTKQFEDMRKRLRQMIGAAKRYHASLQVVDQERVQVRFCCYDVLMIDTTVLFWLCSNLEAMSVVLTPNLVLSDRWRKSSPNLPRARR